VKLRIAKGLALPVEAVTQTFAILAMRGVGKTHTASVLAEELSEAGLPFVVLEPTGAWWGLRASADGKGEGYPVTILGGDHGDVPLEEGGGKLIADLVAEKAPSLILDLSLLSKSAMRRFVADFAEELYRKNRNPLHLIIDEADAFAPQKPRPDELRMLGAIDEIVRRGRIRGLGCTLVTQRSAVLNKDVLTQAEVLIALRTAHPRDRAPVLEWMKVHATAEQLAQVEETLARLPKGDAWVMSAGWLELFRRVHIRERRTFNSSATPEPGVRRIEPKKLAPVDLAKLQERMRDTIERAKASDPAVLRRRIAELEREVARKPAASPAPAKERRVEVPILKDSQVKRLESNLMQASHRIEKWSQVVEELLGAIRSRRQSTPPPDAPRQALQLDAAAFLKATTGPARRVPPAPARPRAGANGAPAREEPSLRTGERRMLEVLARNAPVKRTRAQLGTLAGFTPSGGTFSTYYGRLRRFGFLEEAGDGSVAVTGAGLMELGLTGLPAPMSREEVQARWRQSLRAGEWKMLRALLDIYPQGTTRDLLGEATGFTASGGTFSTYLGVLRRNGLVEVAGDDVHASSTVAEG
jgi:hypothetical protein